MAYIGREPQVGNFQVCDAISVVNGQAAYTMQVNSVNVSPETANHMLVSLNGVLQKPGSSFTVSGSTITFASNLVTGDVIDFIHILGSVLDLGVPSDATVTNAKTNFVSTSSAAGLQIKGDGTTDGTLQLNCSQNSHGIKLKSPAHSTSSSYTLTFPGTDPSADKFLKTDGSGNLSFADAGGGMMTLVTRTAITSDVGEVAFTNLEANNFHKFVFQGIDSTANSGEDFACQVSTDNGSSYITSSNYNWVYWQYYSTGNNNTTGANGSNAIYLADGFHTSGAEDALHGELNIFNVGNGQRFTTYGQSSHRADSSNKRRGTVNAGELEQDATVNAIKFFFDSGNITGSSYAFITHYKGVIA